MIKVPLLRHQRYKSIPTHFPSKNQRQATKRTREKNVNVDTFDGHVMVNYIEPNLQEIIFGPIRVGLITQKQFWDHLKNCHSWGRTPELLSCLGIGLCGDGGALAKSVLRI